MAQYTRIDRDDRIPGGVRDSQISLELESLASSDDDEQSIGSVSSRGLSPLRSPIGSPIEGDNDPRRYNMLHHGRSLSVSTIGDHMIALAASSDPFTDTTLPLEKQKRLNMMHGLSLVIGLQIGSGIFASPNQVNSNAGSVGTSLIVWLIAGLLAWTGASSYAELGSAIPLNGSSQAYLNQIYGPLPSFLFSWTALTVLKPGSSAIIAIIFSEYFCRALGASIFTNYWIQKLIAMIGLLLVVALNSFSTKLGARASNLFLVIKIGVLLAITIIGIVASFHFRGTSALTSGDGGIGGLFKGSSTSIGSYAIALYAGLWAYDGWDNMNYVSAEMKNPRRDLPRVIHTAMPIVIVAYLLANIAYYAVMSDEEIRQTTSVAITFATKTLGPIAGIVFAVLISLSCIGALNATMFSSARLVYSSAEEGFLPAIFCKLHPTRATPVNALLLQSALSCVFILVGEFNSLLTFYGIAGYSFYFLTVSGVIVLRIREPDLDRPYRTFIATPILFCCVALFLVSRTLFEKPLESLFVALFIASGLPIYVWRFGLISRLPSIPKIPTISIDSILRTLKIRK